MSKGATGIRDKGEGHQGSDHLGEFVDYCENSSFYTRVLMKGFAVFEKRNVII